MIVCGVFFLIGIIFFAIGIGFIIYLRKREENCKCTTSATVVEIELYESYDINGRKRKLYKPVVEFYANGVYIKNTYFVGANPCHYYVGQNIIVRYDINNPTKYFIEGEKVTKILGIVFTFVGVVSIIIGITALVYLI